MQKLSKPAAEAFRAIAFLLEGEHQKQLADTMAEALEKLMKLILARTKAEMEEAAELLLATAVSANNTIKELREECHSLTADLKKPTEGAAEAFTFVTQNQENGEWGKNAATTGGGTYADQVKKAIPT